MTAITPLPPAPTISNPAGFNAAADLFIGALPGMVTEVNALEAGLRASATPIALPYTFSSATSGDPGPGYIRLNNATQNAATALLIDILDGLGIDRSTTLAAMGASTNPLKGTLTLSKVGDGSKQLVFDVTAVANSTGYYTLTATCSAYSSASPFSAGDGISVSWVRTGNAGATGAFATWTSIGTTTVSGSPTSVTIASIPTTYSDLAFVFDIPNWGGGTTGVQMATSADGSTFSGYGLFKPSALGARGLILLTGYRLDYQLATCGTVGGGQNNLSSWVPDTSTEVGFRTDGGVVAVRFAAQGNPFGPGTIKALGR